MERRLARMGALVLLAAVAACDSGNTETRTFALSYLDPDQAMMMLEPYVDEGASLMRRTEQPRAITVSASPERLQQIEDLLTRYDVPAPNVRLRFQIIEADGFTNVDPAIADVEAALRDLFRFDGYRLVADAVVSARAYSSTMQRLVGADGVPYSIDVAVGAVTRSANGSSADLSAQLASNADPIFNTQVIVPGGQTVVLGTARPSAERGALILVVRPEIQ